jgi:hypothetical protein
MKKRQQLPSCLKGKKRILEIGLRSIRSHSVYVSLWRKLWPSRKTDYKMNERKNEGNITARCMRPELFWVTLQRVVVISYRLSGQPIGSNQSPWGFLMMEPKDCPETSLINYNNTLRKNPEKRRSHLLRGESLKLLINFPWLSYLI